MAEVAGLFVSGVLALVLMASSLGEKASKFFGDETLGETVRDVDAELRYSLMLICFASWR